jgi:3-dehydroquinate dehydratase type I
MNTPLESEPERISQQPRAMPRHALVASVSRGPVPSGWAEVRLDAWWPTPPDAEQATDDLLRLLGARGGATNAGAPHGQLIATLRPTRQGGAFTGPEKIRLGLLVAAAQAGFGAVDVEADLAHAGAVVRVMHQSGARVILSDHALTAVPSREDGLQRLLAMQDAGADVEKLAFPAVSFADGLRALELAYAHAERGGNPCVVPLGMSAAWRALLAVAGNRLSYGHAHGSPPCRANPPQPTWPTSCITGVWMMRRGKRRARKATATSRGTPSLATPSHTASVRTYTTRPCNTPVAANATVPSMCQTATRLCAWCRWSPTGSAWRAQA